MVGAQAAAAVSQDQLLVHERPQHLVGDAIDLGDLVAGSESVEEVEERHPGPQGGGMGDRREVLRLLDRSGGQHGETGGAGGHDVAVITEDRQSMGGHGAGGHVNDSRGQLPGDLEHVRQHEQQAL